MGVPLVPTEEFDIDTTGGESAFVLRFFYINGGNLRCRVTEVHAKRSWLVAEPEKLRVMLDHLQTTGQTPGKDGNHA